jgi:hypothetical protein
MRVKVVDSHPGAAVAITAQQSGLPTQRSICWRFGNASNVVGRRHHSAAIGVTACSTPSAGALGTPVASPPPQGAETKVVDSHREAAVVITARQSGLPLAALHSRIAAAIGITDATLHLLALWKRQQCGRLRKVRRRKSLTATKKRPSSSQRSNRGYRLQRSIRWRFGNANHIGATARCGSESR